MLFKKKSNYSGFPNRVIFFLFKKMTRDKHSGQKSFRTFKIQHPRCVFQTSGCKKAAPTPNIHVSFRQKEVAKGKLV